MQTKLNIPIIPIEKNYWLVRTQGGKYYHDFRSKGIIAINWDEISLDDIDKLSDAELTEKVKVNYPERVKPSHSAAQLRSFKNGIKKGDTVIITSYGSNKFSIGEVTEDNCFEEVVELPSVEPKHPICTYTKRRRVKWQKELTKFQLDMPMFKLLQHSRATINPANDFGDVIEGLIHDFFIRGDSAQLSLKVKRESNIPAKDFFKLGTEILDIIDEFGEYVGDPSITSDGITTKINVNSEGKAKLIGNKTKIVLASCVLYIFIAGGGVSFTLPENLSGAQFDLNTNGLMQELTEFLDARQQRLHKETIMTKYINDLQIEAPDEFRTMFDAVSDDNSSEEEK